MKLTTLTRTSGAALIVVLATSAQVIEQAEHEHNACTSLITE